MLDFNHILSTPGYDTQYFEGSVTATLTQWQTWRKPRGINWVYMIGVGGGGGGGASRNQGGSSAGGGGGGSGAQTTVLIPAQFVPDILYVQAGNGGTGGSYTGSSGAVSGNNGLPTYVAIEPSTTLTANMTLLLANAGQGGGGGAGSAGTSGTAGTVATIAGMCLAGRGVFNFLAGQAGATGGTTTAVGGSITPPTTGLRVTGGAGGGGNNGATPQLGGAISAIAGALGTDFFPLPLSVGAVASGATPAAVSTSGFISKNFLFNFGGAGGSGSTSTAGGTSGRAGDGAPGCGGGGGGGENSSAGGVSKSGNGGPGFVYIISW